HGLSFRSDCKEPLWPADRDPAAPRGRLKGSRKILECTFESTSRTSAFEAPLTRWTRSKISKRTWQSTFRGKCRGTARQSLRSWMTQKGSCLGCMQKRLQIFFQPIAGHDGSVRPAVQE